MDSQAEGAACDSCPKAITDGTRSRHQTWRGTLCRLASGLARVLVGRFFSRGSIVLLAGHSSGGTSVLPGKLVPCHWSTHSPTLWDGCLECFYLPQGFPGGSDGKESTCQCQETWVWSLGWEDPLEEGMATSSSILVWRIPMDRGAWRATVYGVTKSHTWLLHLALYKHAQRFSSWNNMWLPCGPVVESLPSNAGDVGLIPGLGTKIPHAPEQLNPCAATRAGIAMRSLHAAVKTQHKPEKKNPPCAQVPDALHPAPCFRLQPTSALSSLPCLLSPWISLNRLPSPLFQGHALVTRRFLPCWIWWSLLSPQFIHTSSSLLHRWWFLFGKSVFTWSPRCEKWTRINTLMIWLGQGHYFIFSSIPSTWDSIFHVWGTEYLLNGWV